MAKDYTFITRKIRNKIFNTTQDFVKYMSDNGFSEDEINLLMEFANIKEWEIKEDEDK